MVENTYTVELRPKKRPNITSMLGKLFHSKVTMDENQENEVEGEGTRTEVNPTKDTENVRPDQPNDLQDREELPRDKPNDLQDEEELPRDKPNDLQDEEELPRDKLNDLQDTKELPYDKSNDPEEFPNTDETTQASVDDDHSTPTPGFFYSFDNVKDTPEFLSCVLNKKTCRTRRYHGYEKLHSNLR